MNEQELHQLLRGVRNRTVSITEAIERLKTLPFEDIGYAAIDHHRALRRGFPEVIWGQDKTGAQIVGIMKKMAAHKDPILVTRLDRTKARAVLKSFPNAQYHPVSRTLTLTVRPIRQGGRGTILVISAGTSDIPVAEEALVTARIMGNRVEHLYDVGVAGIHRLISRYQKITEAQVLIVVAGMEGALPSVVAGLVSRPVIAVPTSTGYGASFSGLAALLTMLNSCAAGVAVVNIDNGFGAGCIASLINRT
ncbi:MAG: nickel pincer cofactor biosynthesis protein LarB [Desulfobacterota bacterium]|nr:nickel pincer cofactor biosynthesis protein LarB [Thermodesulfobacteriota bacterium]